MPENTYDVVRAASRVGGLHAYGRIPNPQDRDDAYRSLATSRIDREIRQCSAKWPALDAIQTAHLVGLLLMWGGSDQHTAERAKRSIREILYVAQSSLTDADRAEVARGVLGEQG